MREETINQESQKSLALDVRECIVLTGSQNSHLQETAGEVPEALTSIAGRPFLTYVINHWLMQGVSRFIFSLGHKAAAVEQFLKDNYPTLSYALVVEDHPVGTGGSIRLALQKAREEHVLIVYGLTLFKADMEKLLRKQEASDAECTVVLKPASGTGPCGSVAIDGQDRITSLAAADINTERYLNGGVYLLHKTRFFQRSFPAVFSFEKDYLEQRSGEGVFYGDVQDAELIDPLKIGNSSEAQESLQMQPLDLKAVDRSWTIFIDRDGVINDETLGEYVLHWEQFMFSKGVLQSFKKISDVFGRVLLVTNQKGVGRGLMTQQALDNIHNEMQREIERVGGRLDKIYFCTDTDNTSFFRKPNPGMAWQAKKDFADIDFRRSIMVGNKPSDMRFGRAAGMYTVFLATTNPDEMFPHPDVDLRFPALEDFAAALPASAEM